MSMGEYQTKGANAGKNENIKPRTTSWERNIFLEAEAVARRYSVKKMFLKTTLNSQENTWATVFFNEVAGLQLYLKRGSGLGVSKWILQNF